MLRYRWKVLPFLQIDILSPQVLQTSEERIDMLLQEQTEYEIYEY